MKREEFVASIKVSNQEIITHLSRVWKKKKSRKDVKGWNPKVENVTDRNKWGKNKLIRHWMKLGKRKEEVTEEIISKQKINK